MKKQIVAIGGVGGSGTRVVANIAKEAGVSIGHDLNEALDNLWFALLFVDRSIFPMSELEFRQRLDIFKAVMTGGRSLTAQEVFLVNQAAKNDRIQHSQSWLSARAKNLLQFSQQYNGRNRREYWGWKAPNTHMFLDRLHNEMPELRYIHVVRNGLDMALSKNQNQLRIWGDLVLQDASEISPRNSLRYWRWAHERVIEIGRTMGAKFLLIRFEDLCDFPEESIETVQNFLKLKLDKDRFKSLKESIRKPTSIGRYNGIDLDGFELDDVKYVKSLGYEINI